MAAMFLDLWKLEGEQQKDAVLLWRNRTILTIPTQPLSWAL